MSNLTELKIKNPVRTKIQKLVKRGVRQEISTTIDKDGKPVPHVKILNSEIMEDNKYLVKDALMLAVYKDLAQKDLEDMDAQDYDSKLQDILDYATENNITWIIELKLSLEHAEIDTAEVKKKG